MAKMQAPPMKWKPFSTKQKKVLSWFADFSPYRDYDGIICDGAVRSGKTVSMIQGFIIWSQQTYKGEQFIIAGRSISALKRNVIEPMFQILSGMGMVEGVDYEFKRSEDMHIRIGTNRYYLFGANNEKSQDAVQGMTAAGALLDEVALMPESFVSQVMARLSIDGAKVWFNCNPKSPRHFFKTDYIDRAKERKMLVLHFTMDDNLSLSERVKERFRRQFTGVFYKRNIQGLWVTAEGVIYSMFDEAVHTFTDNPTNLKALYIGVDYGNSNATTFVLVGQDVYNRAHVLKEYYHSGKTGMKKAPSQYAKDFKKFLDEVEAEYKTKLRYIFIDPSAQGFRLELYKEIPRYYHSLIIPAKNDVLEGIETVASLISNDGFYVAKRCDNVLKELESYSWDAKAAERGEDKPIKENDHTLDGIRYVIFTMKHEFKVRKVS